MKILVKFQESIGLQPLQKDISPNQTVENLQVLISLNYAQIQTCKLVYNNQTLENKEAKLRELIPYAEKKDQEDVTVLQINVVKKGEFDTLVDMFPRIRNSFQKNPVVFGGAIVGILFLVLFLIGSSSQEPQSY